MKVGSERKLWTNEFILFLFILIKLQFGHGKKLKFIDIRGVEEKAKTLR